jgi:hypothetical protein
MNVKLSKISTNILKAVVSDVDNRIKSGKISIFLFLKKDNTEEVLTLPYSSSELSYIFDMSKKFPRNIVDFDYQIKVCDGNTCDETRRLKLFGSLPPHLSGAVKKIQYDFDIVSRRYNGSVAYFFKKLPGDEKCSECWDNDLDGSNNSNCSVCGGTGKIRSFTNPYKTICGPIKWQQETYAIDGPGKTLANPTVSISAIADVVMTTDDIIYYASTSEFYRVINRTVSEVKSFPVLQTLISNLIPSGYTDAEICQKKLIEKGIIK